MPRKQDKNLKPAGHKFTREEAKKGGRNSAASRKTRKAIRELLNDYLNGACNNNEKLLALAEQLGLEGKDSIKKLTVVTCLMHTLQEGDVKSLETIQKLLGEVEETSEKSDEGVQIIDDIPPD